MVCPGCVYMQEIVLMFVSFCFIVYDHLKQTLTTAGSENICKINPESADTQHRMWLISQVYCFFVKDVRLRVAVTDWELRLTDGNKHGDKVCEGWGGKGPSIGHLREVKELIECRN